MYWDCRPRLFLPTLKALSASAEGWGFDGRRLCVASFWDGRRGKYDKPPELCRIQGPGVCCGPP